jgi:hypothetical protein
MNLIRYHETTLNSIRYKPDIQATELSISNKVDADICGAVGILKYVRSYISVTVCAGIFFTEDSPSGSTIQDKITHLPWVRPTTEAEIL